MTIYRPRMAGILDVPIEDGDTVVVPIRVHSATVESNDHLQADELELEADWATVGVDPRFVRDANVAFWLEDSADPRRDITLGKPRFEGVTSSIERHASEHGIALRMKAQDYTALFLACKPFPTEGIPYYTDTLLDAWQRICDHTGVFNITSSKLVSTVAALRDAIDFRGGASPELKLSKAVASRFSRQGGPIAVKQNTDAWAVWMQCVGMCGLVSFIDGNRCVVTTTVDLFEDVPGEVPSLIWGSNILECRETARGKLSAKGVGLTSFDPLTGTTIEAQYPPPGDERLQQKRRAAKKSAKAKHPSTTITEIRSEDYEWESYSGVTDPDALYEIAKMAWDQRSRQELEGTLTTAEMSVGNARNGQTDLISLRSGSSLIVQMNPDIASGVFANLSQTKRIEYLLARGYSVGAAQLMAATVKQSMKFGFTFKARKVRTHVEASGDGGKFQIDIDYWNRIELG